MTCVLLAGAALFVKSILTIRASPLGIETSDVTAIIAGTRSSSYLDDEIDAQFERAATALRSLPGVTSSSASLTVPLHSAMGVATFSDGSNAPVVNASGVPYLNAVTQDYFRTVGTRLVRGRTFADIDAAGAPRVAIVNESLGSLIADGNDALGRCLYLGDRSEPCTRIVGIVEDTKRFSILPESPALQIYLPLEQNDFDNMRPSVLLIRAAGSDDLLATPRELERMVRTYAPSAGHVTVRRLDDIVDSQLRPWRLGTNMLMLFGAIALLLGFIGVFAVAWYSTVQRRREIALRVALGASNRDVTRAINAGILAMAGMALLVGTVVSVLGQRYLSSVMYGFDRFSWGAHALVAIGLLIWCLVAGLWPTWRALRIDPAAILKE